MKAHLSLEVLEDRSLPSATAFFSHGVLTVVGTQKADSLLVAADAAGNTIVTNNGQAVAIQSRHGAPNRDNLKLVIEYGLGGNDTLATEKSLDTRDANGVLVNSPRSIFYGGEGNDQFSPGNGGIVGGAAGINDQGQVTGRVVGNNTSYGGAGNDAFTSGPGNDAFYGGRGNDSYQWPPATLTDAYFGGLGKDSAVIVDGGAGSYTAQPVGKDTLLSRITPVQFSVFFDNVEHVQVQTAGSVTGKLPGQK